MRKNANTPNPGDFCWNELVTTNVTAAKKFYTSLLGWKTKPFDKGMVDYTIIQKGRQGMGGIMKCPTLGNPAQWIPYMLVDVDATVKKARKFRGKVCMPSFDVPTVGRIAVLSDPQGAAFGIITPKM